MVHQRYEIKTANQSKDDSYLSCMATFVLDISDNVLFNPKEIAFSAFRASRFKAPCIEMFKCFLCYKC